MSETTTPQGDTTPPVTPTAEGKGGEDISSQPKTFTQEELQKELDRVAAKTRDEEKKKADRLIAEAKKEALEEAKLSEDERLKKTREREMQDLQNKQRELTLRENRVNARDKFAEVLPAVKISDELIDMVTTEDAETTQDNVDKLKVLIDAITENLVTQRLASGQVPTDPKLPKKGAGGNLPIVTSF